MHTFLKAASRGLTEGGQGRLLQEGGWPGFEGVTSGSKQALEGLVVMSM